ncbi:MAG: hypothetical protein JSW67_09560 [Candidatus Latescibacterota bacterium]|nr:MAG: hypothetical protein JSW67_09560 [Candidatus Latescibacterota bacterium]
MANTPHLSRGLTTEPARPCAGPLPESEAALREVQRQVTHAWDALRHVPGGAASLFEQAIRRATPIVPCVVSPRPLSSQDLNRDLQLALCNYHAEEIRVVGFTLFSSLVELANEVLGSRHALRLQRTLDAEA